MHIASAMGTPVVALFGPTNPELQGPFNTIHTIVQNPRVLCLGCNLTTCPIGTPCMVDLTPAEVAQACRTFVEQHHLLQEHGMIR
jgi:heptosyltransferase-1